jgi:hypothetical protein
MLRYRDNHPYGHKSSRGTPASPGRRGSPTVGAERTAPTASNCLTPGCRRFTSRELAHPPAHATPPGSTRYRDRLLGHPAQSRLPQTTSPTSTKSPLVWPLSRSTSTPCRTIRLGLHPRRPQRPTGAPRPARSRHLLACQPRPELARKPTSHTLGSNRYNPQAQSKASSGLPPMNPLGRNESS